VEDQGQVLRFASPAVHIAFPGPFRGRSKVQDLTAAFREAAPHPERLSPARRRRHPPRREGAAPQERRDPGGRTADLGTSGGRRSRSPEGSVNAHWGKRRDLALNTPLDLRPLERTTAANHARRSSPNCR